MAEAFKEKFNLVLVTDLAKQLESHVPNFETANFITLASKGFDQLEMKQRAGQITTALVRYLPTRFEEAIGYLTCALHPDDDPNFDTIDRSLGLTGWPIWPLCDWVALKGIDQPQIALPFLQKLTCRFSAEFAIRHFLKADPKGTLKILEGWLDHPNKHVRRLVSEGTRPLLPWAMKLHTFADDPSTILPLLTSLRDDESEYVRRSVANSLNDVGKHHPDLVATIAQDWLNGASVERKRLIRHACRSLIKKGHTATLSAFGYAPIKDLVCQLIIETPTVLFGQSLAFNANFNHSATLPPMAVVDYAIHFVKKNGTTAPKVFKWKNSDLISGSNHQKKHAIRPISTRTYYVGEHYLEVFVNGVSVAKKVFTLTMETP